MTQCTGSTWEISVCQWGIECKDLEKLFQWESCIWPSFYATQTYWFCPGSFGCEATWHRHCQMPCWTLHRPYLLYLTLFWLCDFKFLKKESWNLNKKFSANQNLHLGSLLSHPSTYKSSVSYPVQECFREMMPDSLLYNPPIFENQETFTSVFQLLFHLLSMIFQRF